MRQTATISRSGSNDIIYILIMDASMFRSYSSSIQAQTKISIHILILSIISLIKVSGRSTPITVGILILTRYIQIPLPSHQASRQGLNHQRAPHRQRKPGYETTPMHKYKHNLRTGPRVAFRTMSHSTIFKLP